MDIKIEIKGIRKKIWEVSVFFAKHVVLSCFLVVLISIGVGFIIFYQNIILADQSNAGSMDSSLDIKKNDYDQIIKAWSEEEERKESADSKGFNNIFYNLPQPSPKPSPSPSPSPAETPQ
ncbi:MAG: hypothetical protein NT148_01165 [Candidatus Nealsonbacteria bacterium]|nr:hypothetical protein [Candidatus Nealsonbacteria bacterium]